jgi:hypothetical protein
VAPLGRPSGHGPICPFQFDQLKRREFITLLGGATDLASLFAIATKVKDGHLRAPFLSLS